MPIVDLNNYQPSGEGDGASGKDLPPYGPGGIYHEKQIGSLCAVHCVNNLLQGPMFDYGAFQMVARQLDKKERELLGDSGEGLDYGNARMDGFFNIQVITAVLQNAGYSVTPVQGIENYQKMDNSKETGFILNKREHWFSIRRIGNEWFDLNSCLKVPRHYNAADVRWHISDAVKEGYSVFVVRGKFPRCALEEDHKKLIEAIQGCGRRDQGYSLFAGQGQTLASSGSSTQPAAAAGPSDAAALRAARLARFGGGGPAPPVPAAAPTSAPVSTAPAQNVSGSTGASASTAGRVPPQDPKLQQLVDMGFDIGKAKYALESAKGDQNAAMELLLQQ